MKKKLLLLGATGGLGKKVIVQLQALKKYEITGLGSGECDVTDLNQCKKVFDLGEFDIVINLTGRNFDKFIHKITIDESKEIKSVLESTVLGSINVAAACLPSMRSKNYGRIIFISSILAKKSVLGTGIYSSTKTFIDRFARSVSDENIMKGITCNSIQLGYFDGGMTEKLNNPEDFKSQIPLKRWGTINELVNTIEYLVETEYLTGQNICIAGGL